MNFLISCLMIFASAAVPTKNSTLKVHEIESSFESRIRAMVHPLDPNAQVFVDIELSKNLQSDYLPGTPTEMDDFSGLLLNNGILDQVVSKIDIKIYSKLEKFPGWLESEIKNRFKMQKGKVSIASLQMEAESIQIIEQEKINPNLEPTIDKVFERIDGFWQQSSPKLFYGLLFLVAFLSVFSLWQSNQSRKVLQNELTALAKVVSEGNQQSHELSQVIDIDSKKPGDPRLALSSTTEKLELSFDQTLALLSDAYWCKQDSYAAYIWKNISNKMRQELINKWPHTVEYVDSLSSLVPENFGLDDHPAYLDPLPVHNLSQQDLHNWLKKNPTAWNHLSPLRQKYLDLNIEDRVSYMRQTTDDKAKVSLPKTISEARVIENKNQAFTLSLEDDIKLFENPGIIPAEERKNFPTLVWLAKCDTETASKIMDNMTARELASAWVGPETVLEKLALALPEKKRKLVIEYANKVPKSRNSNVYIHLFEQGLGFLDEKAA